MEITSGTVKRLSIQDGKRRVWVFLENAGAGRGRLTVICDGDAWTYYWGAMGERTPILETFIPECDSAYLIKKLSPGLRKTVDDLDGLVEDARKAIIRQRRESRFSREKSRALYDRAPELGSGTEGNDDLLYEVYGEEWWYDLPQKPNVGYARMSEIVKTVQTALVEIERKPGEDE